MNEMEESLKLLTKFLHQSTTVHIYSFPYFMLETFFATVVCVIFILLHLEITNVRIRTLKLKPNSITISRAIRETYSRGSYCTSVSKIHQYRQYNRSPTPSTLTTYKKTKKTLSTNSQLGWIMQQNGDGGDLLTQLLHGPEPVFLTPKEYVQLEKQRRKHNSNMETYLKSITTLCDNVLSEQLSKESIAKCLKQAKDEIEDCTLGNETTKYLTIDGDAMSNSLCDLMERIVMASSMNNPFPFRGNITTLVYDVGNLNMKDSGQIKDEDNTIEDQHMNAIEMTIEDTQSSIETNISS